MKYRLPFAFFVYIFLISSSAFSISQGSNTTPGLVPPTLFLSSDQNNSGFGFSLFNGGITLQDNLTTCTFDLVYPLRGPIALNGGTLVLKSDLSLATGAQFASFGTIQGNNKKIQFSTTCTNLNLTNTGNIFSLLDAEISPGTNTSIDWDRTGSYVTVVTSLNASNPEVFLFRVTSTAVTATNSVEYGMNTRSVRWAPFSDRFVVGATAGTNELRSYVYTPATNTITVTQSFNIPANKGVTALAFHPTGSWILIGLDRTTNSTALALYNYSVTPGFFSFQANSILTTTRDVGSNALSWDSAGRYVAVGTANSNNSEGELIIYFFNGTTLTPTLIFDIQESVSAVSWCPTGSFIAVGLSTGLDRFRLYEHVVQSGTLIERTSGRLSLNTTIDSAEWHPNGDLLMVSQSHPSTNSSLCFYEFFSMTKTFSLRQSIVHPFPIVEGRWSRDGSKFAFCDTSTVYVMTSSPNNPLGLTSSTFSYSIFDTTLVLNGNLNSNLPLRFFGACQIEGNNSTINLSDARTWLVNSNSVLTIEDTILSGMSGNKLYALDSTSTIILRNTIILLSSNFSFTSGNILIDGNCKIKGPYTFTLATPGLLTIGSDSSLEIDTRTIFRYAPPNTRREGVFLQSLSSRLYLNGATLSSSTTGLRLSRGQILFDGKCSIASDATTNAQGIYFGDGTPANDPSIIVLPGARVEVTSGFLVNS